MTCKMCRGAGRVLVDLRQFRFGPGFFAFMSSGCRKIGREDGSVHHEITCPGCNGTGLAPPEVKRAGPNGHEVA